MCPITRSCGAVDAPPHEPVLVTGDGQWVTQVVTSLLANARTHTPSGTEITATVVRDEAGGVVTAVL